jgi:pyrroline-5-carboxylate reductase
MKISFIGGGNMAVAMLSGMLQQGFTANSIHVIEPCVEKRTALAVQYKVTVADPSQPLPPSDFVILAVKPQQVIKVLHGIGGLLTHSVLMSIAAGVSIEVLQSLCGKAQRVVRVMPNTPALIGAGISGAFASANINEADKIAVERILQAIGEVVWVQHESALDGITAISGSGPAYVFYFMEALQEAAKNQGFDEEIAKKLVYATFNGAVKLAQLSPEPVSTLRARVTSKKGTTEEGVAILAQHQLFSTVDQAVKAAAKRSQALAQELISSLKR